MQQGSFRAAHPYYHHGLLPNQDRVTSWGGDDYKLITNSLGFRDRRVHDVQLQSSKRRVVLIGDSMIEGLGVEFEDTITGRLQERWSDRNVDVLNAGVVSYSPRIYELKTRYLLEKEGLKFDHLVVFIDISDIQDELFYEAFQPHQLDESNKNPASPHPQPGWWRRNSLTANYLERLRAPNKAINTSFRSDADIHVWMESTEAYMNAERDPELGRFEWTLDESIYTEWGHKGLLLARTNMARLGELCRDHKIDMTVVVYPSPVQIFSNDRDSRQTRFWRAFCEESGHRFIDLFPMFIDHTYAGPREIYQKYFIFGDVHWSPAGHQFVTEKIAGEFDVLVSSESFL